MLEKDDLFEANDKLYVVFEEMNYRGESYCFCNEMVNEKTFGKNFVIFQNFEDGIELVEDKNLIDELLPFFSSKVNIDLYNSYNVNMGEE